MPESEKYLGKYRIESNRCKGYDYTREGAYFLTVCTYQRQKLFGEIVRGKMQRNALGQIVWDEWFRSAKLRSEIELDAFVVMPDHIHGIVFIHPHHKHQNQNQPTDSFPHVQSFNSPVTNTLERPKGPPPKSIGAFMAGFKYAATTSINQYRQSPGTRFWQANYHDRIVRDLKHINRIRFYIANNPRKWSATHDPTQNVE